MDKAFSIVYESSLADLCEVNSSFDRGVLRVAYTGENRNGSSISKKVFEDAIDTMYNCPVVCRYDRDADEIGSHDMEVVNDDKGLRLVNMTHPVGVVPSEAKWFWQDIEDESGSIHEYLCTEVLLWKREEAYQKIKEDGIVKHSMEITVLDSHEEDGIYVIDKFEFTAFCLLGTAEPCFENSALIVYSLDTFKEQFAEMMKEFKESFNLVSPAPAVDDISNFNTITEGGERILEEKLALVAEYGLNVDDLDFALDDFSLDELREKFEEMKASTNKENNDEGFALEKNFMDELQKSLAAEKIDTCWGEDCRYWYVDCDRESMEVYSYDLGSNWELVGHKFSMDGDNVVIDFESRKRKKFEIVDFDEGEQANPIAEVFTKASEAYSKNDSEWAEKFQTASDKVVSMESELENLRQFKADAESAAAQEERNNLFANFEDLTGEEAFESLKNDSSEYSIDELEEKCYAIRGRKGSTAKFNLEPKAPKLPINHIEPENEPYGGLFIEYGHKAKD